MAATQYHNSGFPPAELDWQRLIPLIGPANAAVARYEGVLQGIPNAQVLLSPLTSQEAVLSSKIEGTQATLGEVLEFEAAEESATGDKRDDILEVLNYRKALRSAVDDMKERPLSQRLIRDAHRVLMQGVRGRNKTPGEYRRVANWIGPQGGTVEQARFIPPGPERLSELMTAWEKYIHGDAPDKLLQLALLHAEFEAIHPFLDGNGRLGRLLVPLFLVQNQLLSGPHFYISAFFEVHRDEYYEHLLAVSRDRDWTGWCVFFLQALKAQAHDNEARASAILELYRSKLDWIVKATGSRFAVTALDWFFNQPTFKTSDFVKSAGIPLQTAYKIVREVRDGGLLKVKRAGSGRRPDVLEFAQLIETAEGSSDR